MIIAAHGISIVRIEVHRPAEAFVSRACSIPSGSPTFLALNRAAELRQRRYNRLHANRRRLARPFPTHVQHRLQECPRFPGQNRCHHCRNRKPGRLPPDDFVRQEPTLNLGDDRFTVGGTGAWTRINS